MSAALGFTRATLVVAALMLTACPPPPSSTDAGQGGGSGGTGGGDGGGSGGSGGSADGGCTEAWTCGRWQIDGGSASRACTDANGCGTTAQRPPLGPAMLPALDLPYFRCAVQPVLERGCGMLGCHGTETERAFRVYARARLRRSEPAIGCDGGTVDLALEGTATVQCAGASRLTSGEWQANYDGARAFAIGVPLINDVPLLTQPLAAHPSAHAGVKPFTVTDPAYLTIKNWLGGTTAPAACDAGFN